MRKSYEEASPIQCKGLLLPGEPALKAVRVAAMQVRRLAARKQQLKSRVAWESLNFPTWSPIWKGSTQTGQFPLFFSDTTFLSKAWQVENESEREMRMVKSKRAMGEQKNGWGTSIPVGVMGRGARAPLFCHLCSTLWTTILSQLRAFFFQVFWDGICLEKLAENLIHGSQSSLHRHNPLSHQDCYFPQQVPSRSSCLSVWHLDRIRPALTEVGDVLGKLDLKSDSDLQIELTCICQKMYNIFFSLWFSDLLELTELLDVLIYFSVMVDFWWLLISMCQCLWTVTEPLCTIINDFWKLWPTAFRFWGISNILQPLKKSAVLHASLMPFFVISSS